MEGQHRKLPFADAGIEIRNEERRLATLPYPITEGGTLEASNVRKSAYLMAAAPDLFQALQSLLSAVLNRGVEENRQVKEAVRNAQLAIAKAKGERERDVVSSSK